MNLRILVVLAVLLMAGCLSKKNVIGDPSVTTLISPQGIEYTKIKLPNEERIELKIAWPHNWSFRPETNKAAPHVGSQLLLLAGADGYSPGMVLDYFNDIDAHADIYLYANDYIIGELSFHKDDLTNVLKIVKAHLVSPNFDEHWKNRIVDSLEESLHEWSMMPEMIGYEIFVNSVFNNTVLRDALSINYFDALQTVSKDDVSDWHKQTFTKSPQAIVIAGDITTEESNTIIDDLIGALSDSEFTSQKIVNSDLSPKRILFYQPELTTSYVSLIGKLPSLHQSDFGSEAEDIIIAYHLGGNDQSILFDSVRNTLRASYDFSANIALLTHNQRFLVLSGLVDSNHVDDVERIVMNAYRDFKNQGFEENIDDLKLNMKEYYNQNSKKIDVLSQGIMLTLLEGKKPSIFLETPSLIDSITLQSINNRLHNFPMSDELIVIAISSDKDALPGACVIMIIEDVANCL